MKDISTGVRILFAGDYWLGSNTVYIARAFEKCGAIIRFVNRSTIFPRWESFWGRAARRVLRRSLIESEWNNQILDLVDRFQPDLIYLTNAHLCWSETLRIIHERSIPIMCFYHDVIWDRPHSRFKENLPNFDLVATTRSWQESEFKDAGAKAVQIARFGFDPLVHRPITLDNLAIERYGTDVTFIGTYEAHRAAEITALVTDKFPYHLRLWGHWNPLATESPVRKYWQKRDVHEQEIPVIYAASKVALHWLGWEPHGDNLAMKKGDQHNSRTFQIAACGGAMMLAQRTEEHQHFFTEDKEAVYFEDVHELREKLKYWLDTARDEDRLSLIHI